LVETLSKSPELLLVLQTISQKSSQEDESSQLGKTFKLISKTQAKSSSKKPLLQSANLSFSQTNFMKTSSKPKYKYFIKNHFQNA
jgi:hypothetical protein